MSVPPSSPTSQQRLRLAELQQKLTHIPYCPWVPTPKQRLFLLDFSKEVLFGGAVGGAKSVALLMAALQFVEVPHYAALLIRRSYTDLSQPGALMDLADQWLRGKGPHWDQTTHTWTFPSGATLTFGYIERQNDHLKYQGAAYQFVGFDELTQHPMAKQYQYLFSRMRRPSAGPLSKIPLRMRATSNPGGPGHSWVYERFIKDWEQWKQGKRAAPERKFIPSMLIDNPHLDEEAYLKTLEELDPVTRAQLLRGDWNIRPDGRMFQESWFEYVDYAPWMDTLTKVRYWDLAATDENRDNDPDYTAGCLYARDRHGTYYVMDMQHFRANPAEVERRIMATAERDGIGTQIWMEQEPGSAGKTVISYYRRMLSRFSFHGNLPSGPKTVRAAPVAAQADGGNIKIVRGPWNSEFMDELTIFPDGVHDDQVDALAGAHQIISRLVPYDLNGVEQNDTMTQTNQWDIAAQGKVSHDLKRKTAAAWTT